MSSALALEWASAGRSLQGGEAPSGDRCWARATSHGARLAVVDGLGHGPAAAQAAALTVEVLERRLDEPLLDALRECHHALRETRGAVASVADVDLTAARLEWCGVGNVVGLLRPALAGGRRQRLICAAGVLGVRWPRVRTACLELAPGDLLILATDGLDESVGDSPHLLAGAPSAIADGLLSAHGTGGDDACVLVAHFHRTARAPGAA